MLLATMVVFLLLEGLASSGFFIHGLVTQSRPPLAERNHTEYDSEIGWVNKPGVALKNLYGPGLDLHTNSQGFRGSYDFTREVPAGKLRIVCTGDSFALGYGVADNDTWCSQLSAIDPRFETVNMGQGGYGVDQAYLWYMRDSGQIVHDVHLFSFIYGDFVRIMDDSFLGYGKPKMVIENGELTVRNVPVPRKGHWMPWFTENSDLLDELHIIAALRGLLRKFSGSRAATSSLGEVMEVALMLFDRLAAHHLERGSEFILVYLPVEEDYAGHYEDLRQYLARWTRSRGILFIDPTNEFRALPASQATRLFIAEGPNKFPDAAGHYNALGNRWVATIIEQRLKEMPEVSSRIGAQAGGRAE